MGALLSMALSTAVLPSPASLPPSCSADTCHTKGGLGSLFLCVPGVEWDAESGLGTQGPGSWWQSVTVVIGIGSL